MSMLLINSNVGDGGDKDSILTLSSNIVAANGSQNNTCIDSSVNNATITRGAGVSTQGSFSPYGNQWSSLLAGGSSGSLSSNSSLTLAGNFTLECWVFLTGAGRHSILGAPAGSKYQTGWGFEIFDNLGTGAAKGLTFALSPTDGYGGGYLSTGQYPTLNTWAHVAFSRTGSALSIFLDGVKGTNAILVANNGTFTGGTIAGTITIPVCIGDFDGYITGGDSIQWASGFTGYISNLRVLDGTALYTENFTPQIAQLTAITNTVLLTCQSNSFKDNSINNHTLTVVGTPSVSKFSPYTPPVYSPATVGGSYYFNGTNCYLYTPGTAALSLGTSDFTIDGWIYSNSISTHQYIVSNGTAATVNQFSLQVTGSKITFGTPTSAFLSSSTILSSNTWYFIAVTRLGSSVKLWINRVLDTSVTNSTNFSDTTSTIYVSRYAAANTTWWNGYISDLRIIKGTALYTANSTPPIEPLTAIANTQLLLSGTNAGIIDSTANTDLVTIGSAQVDTAIKKYGSGSIKFNGTTDFLIAPANPNYAFGTGSFTIECWMYPNGTQVSSACLVSINAVTSPYVQFGYNTTNGINIIVGTTFVGTNTTVPTSLTWSHVAAVRSGSTLTIYLNGVGTTPTTNSTAITGGLVQVGAANGGSLFKGNIADLRVSKFARYTSNFTPLARSL